MRHRTHRIEGGWACGALAVLALAWLLPADLQAEARDRRETVARQSALYRSLHFPDGRMPPKHDWRSAHPLGLGTNRETPGGVGYGFYFDNNSLLWTNSTTADYYVIAPTDLGGSVSYLYLTSTCRAQLGTESLVAYDGTSDPQFWIYDWAQPTNSRWQVTLDLPYSGPQYLTNRPDEFGVDRQMIHLRNATLYLGSNAGSCSWRNRVMLFDFAQGGWDLVYSYDYTTANLTNNYFSTSGSPTGFWGPIVETFGTYTNVNPVGFDLIRLFRDGNSNSYWLSPGNCYVQKSAPWQLLTFAPNTAFTAAVSSTQLGTGSNTVGTLCVTANTAAASFSLSSGGGSSPTWVQTPDTNNWDEVVAGLPPGTYSITFQPAAGLVAPAPQVFTITTNQVTMVQAIYEPTAADNPVAVTGFNRDVVVENTAFTGNTAPYAQPFAPVRGEAFYEANLGETMYTVSGDGATGLPESRLFVSLVDGATTFQFAPYTDSNVLFLNSSTPTGTLTLAVPAAYNSLSILAASSSGGGSGAMVINFVDGTSNAPLPFSALDWESPSSSPALSAFGLISTGNYGVFYTRDAYDLPNLYQTSIDLAALGLNAKTVASISFTMPSGNGTSTETATGIFALSGTVAPPALQPVCKDDVLFSFSWTALLNRYYQIQYATDLTQTAWLDFGSSVLATNYIMDSEVPGRGACRFYRVVLLP